MPKIYKHISRIFNLKNKETPFTAKKEKEKRTLKMKFVLFYISNADTESERVKIYFFIL